MHLSSVHLPEPFEPMSAERRAGRHLEVDVLERPELLVAGAPPLRIAAFRYWLRSW